MGVEGLPPQPRVSLMVSSITATAAQHRGGWFAPITVAGQDGQLIDCKGAQPYLTVVRTDQLADGPQR